MVAGMSCRRSNILMATTRFLAADTPLLRIASSPKRRSTACASGTSVAYPRSAPRTSCMYVLDKLASTPLMAIPVPTVPHSSVLACMTLSWASHAIPTVVTPWAGARGLHGHHVIAGIPGSSLSTGACLGACGGPRRPCRPVPPSLFGHRPACPPQQPAIAILIPGPHMGTLPNGAVRSACNSRVGGCSDQKSTPYCW